MLAIYKKEIKNYFKTMTGYVFLFFFVLISAAFFFTLNVLSLNGDYAYALSGSSIMFLIMIPLITMRLFAEEAAQKTDQLLYTSPVSVSGIVLGKFLAAISLFAIGLLITGIFPLMLSRFGTVPVGQTIGAFIGYLLLGMCFISVGLFISVMTNNQIVAAAGTFAVIFFLYILDGFTASIPTDRTSSLIFAGTFSLVIVYLLYDSTKNIPISAISLMGLILVMILLFFVRSSIYDGLMVKAISWVSLMSRFNNFYAGILNISDILYYLSFSVAFNFLTVMAIEKRRWS